MKNFSLSRVVTLIKKDFSENRKTLILRAVLLIGILTINTVFMGIINLEDYTPVDDLEKDPFEDPQWSMILVSFIVAAFIVSSISASFIMETISTKGQRLTTLMIPATMLEKYVARWTIYIVGASLLFLAACFIAELTRYGILSCLCGDSTYLHLMTPSVIFDAIIVEGGELYRQPAVIFGLALLFIQSVFGLGSSIWPSKSFIKTFGAYSAIGAIYTHVAWIFGLIILDSNMKYNSPIFESATFIYSIELAVLAIIVFNWVLAYYRFKESEIIQRM